MSLQLPYKLDPSQQLVLAVTSTDGTLTVPQTTKADAINNPGNTGSEWFLSVDGNPVAINVGAPAVFASNAILEVGLFSNWPIYLEPGAALHFICASSKTAVVSLIRARRTG
jgi:hypothetical protein